MGVFSFNLTMDLWVLSGVIVGGVIGGGAEDSFYDSGSFLLNATKGACVGGVVACLTVASYRYLTEEPTETSSCKTSEYRLNSQEVTRTAPDGRRIVFVEPRARLAALAL